MDQFDARLSRVLQADAERAVIPIDPVAIAVRAMATGRQQRRRRSWLIPVLAVVLLGASLLGGALLAGRVPVVPQPSPVQATPDPSTLAIVLRRVSGVDGTVDVIGVAVDGTQRVLRTLDPDDLRIDGTLSTFGAVSPQGDLAVAFAAARPQAGDRYVLVSLAEPDRVPVVVAHSGAISGSWSSTGWFAAISPEGGPGWSVDVTDPAGRTSRMGPLDLPGGGPELVWAADGSGLLVRVQGVGRHGIAPVDGGPVTTTIPHLAFRGPRFVAAGGRVLLACLDCPNGPAIRVVPPGGDAAAPDWLPSPAPIEGTPVDASFASDDTSLWILFRQPAALVLARVPEPGRVEMIATIPINPATEFASLEALAADDSLISIGHSLADGRDSRRTIVRPATGLMTSISDPILGFVSWPLDQDD